MAILERPTPVARHGDFCLQGTQFYAAPLTVAAFNGDTVDADAASTSSSDIYGFVGPKGFNAIGASTDTTYARIYTIIYISSASEKLASSPQP
ncbi:hypothetical protein CGCVW01_v012531 [Colletotrichum viniferum]|nr:hypothetical protein CGCVW01_v012531 [Colletotrichum viniferum]